MFLFKKKSPEEKAAAQLEKLRRNEGYQGFAIAMMHPADGDLALGDMAIVRLFPETQELRVTCHKKCVAIPYQNLRAVHCVSEKQIVKNECAVSLEEMDALLEGGADQFIPSLRGNKANCRWFMRLDYVSAEGEMQHIYGLVCTARGYYKSECKLYAADQFEVIFADILSRFPQPDPTC